MLDRKGYVKLVDFGLAKQVGHNKSYTMCGTPDYLGTIDSRELPWQSVHTDYIRTYPVHTHTILRIHTYTLMTYIHGLKVFIY